MNGIHILLVEDNEGDILLTKEALLDGKIVNEISIANDGEEAIEFLEKILINHDSKLPDLILLDVNLPKKNGHEVLKHIKHHDNLKQIPVIMLTTSSSEKDIQSSYKNYVNCYITKPIEVQDFIRAVSEIENFWFNIVQRPSQK